eukprot:12001121-Ditylum_brightwellii.AAC.1
MTSNEQGIVPDPAPSSGAKNKQKRGYGGNRNFRRNNQRRNQGHNVRHLICTPKFEGRTPELKGHAYDTGYGVQASCFITTTRKFAEYAGQTCSNSGDIRLAILNQEDVKFKLPTLDMYPDLQGVDKKDIAAIVIKQEYDIYAKQRATYNNNKTRMHAI